MLIVLPFKYRLINWFKRLIEKVDQKSLVSQMMDIYPLFDRTIKLNLSSNKEQNFECNEMNWAQVESCQSDC